MIRYTIHSYAGLNTPAGERYGGQGGELAPVISAVQGGKSNGKSNGKTDD